jgi:monoamine oxidase
MGAARIAIVGGGLAGLYAAHLLESQGVKDYLLIEAREALGGRIESTPSPGLPAGAAEVSQPDCNRFDLGPTWFWPALQPELDRLVHELGLARFAQHETGDMLIEHSANGSPMRMPGYASAPPSMRLQGGMGALVHALHQGLDPARRMTGQPLRRLRCGERHVELETEGAHGKLTVHRAEQVLLAVPPRLAAATIDFAPALPDALAREWRDTATWMAPHAKYLATYDTPFWREQGLSGEARGTCGPLGEIHDASMPGGSAALFGFFAIPARARSQVRKDQLLSHCRAQLARLFGPQAATPRTELIKDWAGDPYTATAADRDAPAHAHGMAPSAVAASGIWRGRLTGIASEWSPRFSGYLAGAVEAAGLGVQALLRAPAR